MAQSNDVDRTNRLRTAPFWHSIRSRRGMKPHCFRSTSQVHAAKKNIPRICAACRLPAAVATRLCGHNPTGILHGPQYVRILALWQAHRCQLKLTTSSSCVWCAAPLKCDPTILTVPATATGAASCRKCGVHQEQPGLLALNITCAVLA